MGIKLRHLPYVQLRGEVFRYRRPVPPPLRGIVGKREILISLQTRDPGEAELRFLEVHLSTERWFRSLAGNKAASNPTAFCNLNQATPSIISDFIIISQKIQSKSGECFRISDCLKLYLKEKAAEYSQYNGRNRRVRINEKYRVIDYLIASIGEDKELSVIKREDARAYRSYLQSKGLKAASVQKNIQICAAIIEMGLREKGINISNPFRRLSVAADVLAKEARLPLSSWETAQMLKGSVNEELCLIRQLLVLTGARLNEIAGLEWADITLPSASNVVGYLDIKSNAIRRLKTASSVRKVPLLPEATKLILSYQDGPGIRLSGHEPVFPRYGRPGGGDAASAALMKSLRATGINDPRKSIHSIRHTVKQQLRDAGCPKDVRDAIQGHASNSISENYGLGHSLAVMLDWMIKAFRLNISI